MTNTPDFTCFVSKRPLSYEDAAYAYHFEHGVVHIHKEYDHTRGLLRKQWLAKEKERLLTVDVPGVPKSMLVDHINRTFPVH